MRLTALILALACASPAAAQEVFVQGVGPVLSGPLSTSGLLNLSGLSCTASLICLPDSDSWNCVDGAGATVAVTQGTSTGFELTPFVPGSDQTARYAARIDTDAKAPKLTTPSVLNSFWTGDHTFVLVAAPGGAAAISTMFSQYAYGVRGFRAYGSSTVNGCQWHNAAGAGTLKTSSVAIPGQSARTLVTSCRWNAATKVGTARVNGNQSAAAAWDVQPAAATVEDAWFGKDGVTAAVPVTGAESLAVGFACNLTDTELLRIENQWAGTIAESRNVPTDRNSTAGWVAPDGYYYALGDDMGRVDARGLLVGEGRSNSWTNSLAAGSWAAGGTPTVSANTESGPFSRYSGAAEADTVGDDDGAGVEFFVSPSVGNDNVATTTSCYLKAGTSTGAVLRVSISGGTGSGSCYFTALDGAGSCTGDGCLIVASPIAGWFRASCTKTAGDTPTNNAGVLYPCADCDTAANTGNVIATGCQHEYGAFASQPVPAGATATARLPDKPLVLTTGFPTAEGRYCMRFTPEWVTPAADSYILDTRTGTNGVAMWIDSSRRLNASTGNAGGTSAVQSAALTWTAGEQEACIEHRGGNIFAEQNHVRVASDVTGAALMPTAHAANAGICATVAGASQLNAWCRGLVVSQ